MIARVRTLSPRRRLALAGVAAALATGVGVALGQGVAGDLFAEQQSVLARPAFPDAPELVLPYHDREAAFRLDYPASWQRLEPDADDVDLLAANGDGASLLVRTTPLRSALEPGELETARDLVQRELAGVEGVELLAPPTPTTLGGLQGWWYLYALEDPRSDRRAIHSHYFVFDGDRMITLVLQAMPRTRFRELAPVFDRIAGSFRTGL